MSFFDKIISAANNLVNLKIITFVGDYNIDKDTNLVFDSSKPVTDAIISNINLVDGDITTAIAEKFMAAPYDVIRDYHNKREEQGQAIISRNVDMLKDLVDLIVHANNNKDALKDTTPAGNNG